MGLTLSWNIAAAGTITVTRLLHIFHSQLLPVITMKNHIYRNESASIQKLGWNQKKTFYIFLANQWITYIIYWILLCGKTNRSDITLELITRIRFQKLYRTSKTKPLKLLKNNSNRVGNISERVMKKKQVLFPSGKMTPINAAIWREIDFQIICWW